MQTISPSQLFTFWGGRKIFWKTAWAKFVSALFTIIRIFSSRKYKEVIALQILYVRGKQREGNPKLSWPGKTWLLLHGLIFQSAFGKGLKWERKIKTLGKDMAFSVCFNEEIWCIFFTWLVSTWIQIHQSLKYTLDLQSYYLNVLIIKSSLGLISS